jgi:hypothetical protein
MSAPPLAMLAAAKPAAASRKNPAPPATIFRFHLNIGDPPGFSAWG